MIAVLVTFTMSDKFDRSSLSKLADELRGPFEGMPGLRFKGFAVADDDLQAKNFYVWDDEEKARAFFTEELVEMVTGVYCAPPTIEYLDIVGFVDNSGIDARATPVSARSSRRRFWTWREAFAPIGRGPLSRPSR